MERAVGHIAKERLNVVSCIFSFLLLSFISQLFLKSAPGLAFVSFVLSTLILMLVLLIGNRDEMFLFLYFISAMSITIPFVERREYDLVLPSAFLVVAIVRFFPKFLHIKRQYLHPFLVAVFLFLLFCLIGIFNNIKVPGINAAVGENSGLLNRFNLLNSGMTFFAGLLLFDYQRVERWIDLLFKFYLVILFISLVIISFQLKPFPLFNSFTWSLVIESQESRKMIIAGLSSSIVLIYTMIFVKQKAIFYPLIFLSLAGLILSGNRTFFFAGLFILFFSYVVKRKALGKSLLVIAAGIVLALYLLLTPIVLLVPEKFQRLVIIFPPEYYTGELAPLGKSAAASSSNFRLEIWTMAVEKIKERPLIGNSFKAPVASYDFEGDLLKGFQKIPSDVLNKDFLRTGSLHNTFMSIAYLLGIPALVFFLYFFTGLIGTHYRKSQWLQGTKRRVSIFIVIMLLNYFVAAMAGDIIFDLQFFLFLAISLKALLFYYNEPPQNYKEPPQNVFALPK